jgi:hypothetical protein
MAIVIEGLNGGRAFELPPLCIEDEEAKLKAIIRYKREHKDELDIPEAEQLARAEGSYAMVQNILRRVPGCERVTVEQVKRLSTKSWVEIQNELVRNLGDDVQGEGPNG